MRPSQVYDTDRSVSAGQSDKTGLWSSAHDRCKTTWHKVTDLVVQAKRMKWFMKYIKGN